MTTNLEPDQIDEYRTQLWDARRSLARRLAEFPRAHSVDGQTFGFVAPIASDFPVGGYVRLQTQNGLVYLGQVNTKQVAEREGPEINVAGDAGLGASLRGSTIASTSFRLRLQFASGDGVLLGRLNGHGIVAPQTSDVFEEAEITIASVDDVETYLTSSSTGRPVLDIGTLAGSAATGRASLLATGFDRHTFLCGQSGSGKTYSLGVILERLLLETDLRIVIIDPNSDFVGLGETRSFEEVAKRPGAPTDLEAFNALRDRYLAATSKLKVFRPARRGSHSPDALRIRFCDFTPAIQGMVMQLDPLADREEFSNFWGLAKRFGDRPYSLTDLRAAASSDLSEESRRVALRITNLGVADWELWAEEGDATIATMMGDWRSLVFDVGGFGASAEKSLVALGVLNAAWNRREERNPVLIVIDEAHNICPAEPADHLQAAATERLIQIAGEGRKFGIYLLLSTQRPQKLHPNVLSQCDNLVLMRMNSVGDLEVLSNAFSFVPDPLLKRSSFFNQGEALLAGKIVPSPIFARFGFRISKEGGSDVPTDWATVK